VAALQLYSGKMLKDNEDGKALGNVPGLSLGSRIGSHPKYLLL
jgi:hypothetical protein